ncbi:hypothetical protein M8J77_013080 [Diaphorina citri]|nr:hypothetical protein M8J77_013080 [Diaphorina citri]
MSVDNGFERKVELVQEGSPFSMSDEDTPDSLEIKPPQASTQLHKSHHRSHKDKHSSHRTHGSSSSSQQDKSSSQHKSHHRSRHRDERDRRHHHKEKERDRNKSDQSDGGHKSHRRRDEDRKHRDERKAREAQKSKEYTAREIDELKAKEADLRARLERKRYSNPLREKEKIERELRKERLLEAERVKEAYKERVKDVEQKRKRYRTRSRSRSPINKAKNEMDADEAHQRGEDDGARTPPGPAAPESRSRQDLEAAGLVVLTDESRSPTPQRDEKPGTGQEEGELAGSAESSAGSEESSQDGSEDSSQDSSSSDEEENDENEDKADKKEKKAKKRKKEDASPNESERDVSPHVIMDQDVDMEIELEKDTLPPYLPAIQGCRSVEEFKCLNRIEEGTYGVVYRAKDKRTDEIVALKRLKMEKEKEGFPITSLREINTLLKAQHPNIVTVREIVVGSNMDKIFIVMDYVEHDMKSLMETMRSKKQVFIPGEVKCLMQQLLNAVAHLHDNWILHRDLKTSNLLLSHRGILKVGDFGLAREYGSPLKHYTPIVVTLWYRSPELLLGCKEYSTPIDMWSVGCIFAEFLCMEPLFTGKSDLEQLSRIFKTMGTPNEKIWPGFSKLPAVQKMTFAEYPNVGGLKTKVAGSILTELGYDLLCKFLTYDPVTRITADEALRHDYFSESPLPIDPAMFPTWPAKSELAHKKAAMASPKPPSGGHNYKQLEDNEEGFHMGMMERSRAPVPGFSLKF